MTTAVADATVLIYLAKLGELSLLADAFETVHVPEAVYTEVVDRGRSAGYRDAMAVDEAMGDTLILAEDVDADRVAELQDVGGLGRGEAAAIALAAELDARCLTDDHAARSTATALGVSVGGTLYVLLDGLERGAYGFDGYVDRLDRLTESGFRIDASLYRRAVEAGRAVDEA